jgi:hypothetical protein
VDAVGDVTDSIVDVTATVVEAAAGLSLYEGIPHD